MRAAQPHGSGQAEMWGRAMGRAPLLLLLLLPGAVALRCLRCGNEAESCRDAREVTCPPESDVCAEALASVTWSHGRLALGGRGCGRGRAGLLARAIGPARGLVVFARRRQCTEEGEGEGEGRGGACNGLLPMGTESALPIEANVTARAPNGLRCFGCPDDGPCSPPTVVECYGDLRGCFHGNVTVTLDGSRRWREVRGCVQDPTCTMEPYGDDTVGLEGSCCAGDLCNGPIGNRSLFAPDLPRLELLPQPHSPTAGPIDGNGRAGEGGGKGSSKMAASISNMAATVANATTSKTNMAASMGNMAPTIANAATGKTNMAASIGNMAATIATVATDKTNMAASIGNMAATGGTKMAASIGNMAPTGKTNMAASIGNMAPTIANAPATQSNMAAAIDASAESKMAAGTVGRPMERKDGVKGPVGRSQPLGGAGFWPLPFLLLLLL